MSGYFSQLVARSSGTADVVRPRLRSLFEPPKPEASLRSSERDFDQASVLEQTERVEDSTMRHSEDSAQETARLAHKESVPSLFEHELPGKEGGLSDSRSKRPEVSELSVGERQVSADEAAHLTPAANQEIAKPRGRERLETEKPAVVPRIMRSRAIERVSEADPQPHGIFVAERADLQSSEPAPSRDIFGLGHRVGNPDSSLISPVLAPVFSTRASRRRSLRADSENAPLPSFGAATVASAVSASFLASVLAKRFEKPDAGANFEAPGNEPTVNVTIGRVEVRATLADKPTRKEQAATAVMSLADYLRNQRSGAGR